MSTEFVNISSGDNAMPSLKSEAVFNDEVAREFIRNTDKTLDKTGQLLQRAIDARDAMDSLCELWKASWVELHKSIDGEIVELRRQRMAFDSEQRQLMAGLREVRQFFIDKEHGAEVERLRQFVEVCERLKALKDSGFLDTVADTMLKLSA